MGELYGLGQRKEEDVGDALVVRVMLWRIRKNGLKFPRGAESNKTLGDVSSHHYSLTRLV